MTSVVTGDTITIIIKNVDEEAALICSRERVQQLKARAAIKMQGLPPLSVRRTQFVKGVPASTVTCCNESDLSLNLGGTVSFVLPLVLLGVRLFLF